MLDILPSGYVCNGWFLWLSYTNRELVVRLLNRNIWCYACMLISLFINLLMLFTWSARLSMADLQDNPDDTELPDALYESVTGIDTLLLLGRLSSSLQLFTKDDPYVNRLFCRSVLWHCLLGYVTCKNRPPPKWPDSLATYGAIECVLIDWLIDWLRVAGYRTLLSHQPHWQHTNLKQNEVKTEESTLKR